MNRIKFFRRQASLTQEQLAKAIGANQTKVYRWETGRIRVPGKIKLKIMSILGLPKEVLFPDSEVLSNEKTNPKG